jgi:hypothetical protein
MRRLFASAVCLVCCSCPAIADDPYLESFPLRSHNPFVQIFGLPAFQTATLTSPSGFVIGISVDITNDADDSESDGDQLIIDGETTTIALSLRRRVHDRLELGLDVPYVRHSGGTLDGFIKDWHSMLGLSNARRDGPNDQLRHFYINDGETLVGLDSPVSGIGDMQLSAAMAFGNLTLRGAVKLPTGDPQKLTGSGATDFSLGVYGSRAYTFRERDLGLSGFVGALALGDGDVLPEFQRSFVPFGGVALRWQATQTLGLAAQLSMQGSYFDTHFDDIGGNGIQLAVGTDYQAGSFLWRLAIAEDLKSGATADFAMQLSVRYTATR